MRFRQPFRDLGAPFLKQKEEPVPRPGWEHTWHVGSRNARSLEAHTQKGARSGWAWTWRLCYRGHGAESALNPGYSGRLWERFHQGSDVI